MGRIHDVGGMHGFGEIRELEVEEAFYEAWEARIFGLMRSLVANGIFGIDEFRHAVEQLPPQDYLSWSYFERWLYALENLAVEKGVLRHEDVKAMLKELPTGQ